MRVGLAGGWTAGADWEDVTIHWMINKANAANKIQATERNGEEIQLNLGRFCTFHSLSASLGGAAVTGK